VQPGYFFSVGRLFYFFGPLMKTPAPDASASSTPARKRTKTRPATRRRTDENTYTDPTLRERLKTEIRAAAKGGEPGTWSARKSQLLTLAYQKAGGGYLQRHPNSKQKSLSQWTDEAWKTSDDKPARRPGGTTRYLPAEAWNELSPAEKKATNAKKQAGSKAHEHVVANTAAAKRARKQSE
jgi:hypothetical protein